MLILGDFQTSVRRALEEIEPRYENLNGVVICGTHQPRLNEVPDLIQVIKNARETDTPFLGICYGHQLAAIEYAQNVLGIEGATSEEFWKPSELPDEKNLVVRKRPGGLNVGWHQGQSYWNNYEVVITCSFPDHFITTQFHPEYQSTIDHPHPLLTKFIELCKKK